MVRTNSFTQFSVEPEDPRRLLFFTRKGRSNLYKDFGSNECGWFGDNLSQLKQLRLWVRYFFPPLSSVARCVWPPVDPFRLVPFESLSAQNES